MKEFDSLLFKLVLGVAGSSFVTATLIRLASWYKYVNLLV